jgi:hypothetical protein
MDIVQLVARELAANAIVRTHAPVTMLLSKSSDVVRLEVHDAPSACTPALSSEVAEARYRSRFIELLSLQWGPIDAASQGVWVDFDARSQRHTLHAARRLAGFTRGQVPGVRGTLDPVTDLG